MFIDYLDLLLLLLRLLQRNGRKLESRISRRSIEIRQIPRVGEIYCTNDDEYRAIVLFKFRHSKGHV